MSVEEVLKSASSACMFAMMKTNESVGTDITYPDLRVAFESGADWRQINPAWYYEDGTVEHLEDAVCTCICEYPDGNRTVALGKYSNGMWDTIGATGIVGIIAWAPIYVPNGNGYSMLRFTPMTTAQYNGDGASSAQEAQEVRTELGGFNFVETMHSIKQDKSNTDDKDKK